ncbi:MAG: hypothetical protein M9887_03475 [Chitinophagales bacterium]|nr:hypothetical protein [Chitinophagales bacterium]
MRKIIYSAFLFLGAMTFLTSCQKDSTAIVQESLGARLANDSDFEAMINATSNMATDLAGITISEQQGQAVMEIFSRGKELTSTDKATLQKIFGSGFENFTTNLGDFLASVNNLEANYKLSELSQSKLNVVLQEALNANPTLKEKLLTPITINGKSAGADVCNLVVNIAALLGGGALCTAIGVSTIPVVGGVLCTVVVGLAKGILGGLCGLIP